MQATIAPFQYAAPVSDDIHKLKYHRKLACGRDLGVLLAAELAQRAGNMPEILVPVPLHWRRRFQRGFNQSVEIARHASTVLNIPIAPDIVKRHVHTAPQVGLTPSQRRRNIRQAFEVTSGSVPGSAAVVDDVITSGATVSSVARCLRDAGVERVVAWAVARA